MQGNRKLSDYNFKDGSLLHVCDRRDMQIKVQTQTGKTSTLDVVPSLSVLLLKHRIESIERIPIDQQFLTFGTWVLMDDRTLSVYNIQKEDTMIIRVRHRTGGNGGESSSSSSKGNPDPHLFQAGGSGRDHIPVNSYC